MAAAIAVGAIHVCYHTVFVVGDEALSSGVLLLLREIAAHLFPPCHVAVVVCSCCFCCGSWISGLLSASCWTFLLLLPSSSILRLLLLPVLIVFCVFGSATWSIKSCFSRLYTQLYIYERLFIEFDRMLLSDDRMNAEDATASSSADDTATDADK